MVALVSPLDMIEREVPGTRRRRPRVVISFGSEDIAVQSQKVLQTRAAGAASGKVGQRGPACART